MHAFAYADPSSWEEWQRDYRYGAFYIFPPPGVIEAVDLLRSTHDPASAAICQAHISLSEPLKRPLTGADLEELRARLAAIEPFEIRYGPLRTVPPYPGVIYAITPEERIAKLRSAIHAAFIFGGIPVGRSQIAPHMTIAEFITVERTAELVQ
jgi:2'-5' RNA ligase